MSVGINGQPTGCERCGSVHAVYAWTGALWVCERCRLASIGGAS